MWRKRQARSTATEELHGAVRILVLMLLKVALQSLNLCFR